MTKKEKRKLGKYPVVKFTVYIQINYTVYMLLILANSHKNAKKNAIRLVNSRKHDTGIDTYITSDNVVRTHCMTSICNNKITHVDEYYPSSIEFRYDSLNRQYEEIKDHE